MPSEVFGRRTLDRLRGDGDVSDPRPKRSWKSRLLELLFWTAIAVLTAVILVQISERVLPPNF